MTNELISPLRIDFAGGWIDVPDFHKIIPGYVVNAAISPYIRQVKNQVDFKPYLVPGGGISSSTGALILGILEKLTEHSTNKKIYGTPQEFAEMIFFGENVMIEHKIGRQDQYAISLGGINCLRFGHDGFHVHDFEVDTHIDKMTQGLADLEKKLLLVHSGIKRPAQDIVSIVRKNIESGKTQYMQALTDIASMGRAATEAIRKESYASLAEIMSSNWEAQKRLVPECTNQDLDSIYNRMLRTGAQGGKMCGCGGGGYYIFYCDEREKVKAEAEKIGLQTIEPKFEMQDVLSINNLTNHCDQK